MMISTRLGKRGSRPGVGWLRRRAGGSLVEMALVMPLLIYMAFGLVEFGQFMYIKHAFEAAARDGMRIAVLSNSTQAQVTTALTNTLAQANVTYNSSWLTITDLGPIGSGSVANVANVALGDEMRLTLTTTYGSIANIVRPLYQATGVGISASKTVTGQCTMVKE